MSGKPTYAELEARVQELEAARLVLIEAQPEAARRTCALTFGPCLDASYRLGG